MISLHVTVNNITIRTFANFKMQAIPKHFGTCGNDDKRPHVQVYMCPWKLDRILTWFVTSVTLWSILGGADSLARTAEIREGKYVLGPCLGTAVKSSCSKSKLLDQRAGSYK